MSGRASTRAKWQSYVKDYDRHHSSKSKSQYCRELGISATTFCKWHNHFHKKDKGSFIRVNSSPKYFYVKFFGIRLVKLELSV